MRIEHRFRLACAYCFKDSIVSLWSVMSEDEKEMESDRLNASKWIPYLMEKDKNNWPKSSQDPSFRELVEEPFWNATAIRNILQLIKPEERPVFLYKYLDYNDKYPHPPEISMYYEIEEFDRIKLFQKNYVSILNSYFHWPLLGTFLNIANHFYPFLELDKFRSLTTCLFIKIPVVDRFKLRESLQRVLV
ncbi:hypothetical protein CDAR_537331 [Caerostris darwini]|uniref:Uncharacterized protein n=1 Tax=Caerostris darwini TaxID=1538125 RepID=A0AAV4MYP7_9ARAC|nr:hypothetical protein CDAR_537331 [Caerostris darwini]